MNICLLVLWGDSLTYTIARALAFNGHQVEVRVADPARHQGAVWGTPERIAAISGVTVVTDGTDPSRITVDRLIVQGHPLLLQYDRLFAELAAKGSAITAITAGDRSRPYRQAMALQWREWRWYGPWFRKVERIVYKDGYYPIDLLSLFRSRHVSGFDAHSKFLHDEALFRAIHALDWTADALRPARANFLGSRDPESRRRLLAGVEAFFAPPDSEVTPPKQTKPMIWHAYTDAEPAALPPDEFLKALSDSDFTLSPPGYSLVTHRPVEAMLRGSIPVLNANELDLYGLGLVDGVNCIAVRPGGWPAAMTRIAGMDETTIVTMRRHIRDILAHQLTYPALSLNICRRLGVIGSCVCG